VVVRVNVDPGAPAGVTDEATVTGGGAASASTVEPVQISSTPTGFGLERYSLSATNEDGSASTQAGSRPYALTAQIGLNQTVDSNGNVTTAGSVKDLDVELPPGMIVDANGVPQCTETQFAGRDCADNAAVGVALTTFEGKMFPAGVYNLVPLTGEPARLGIFVDGTFPLTVDFALRSAGDGLSAYIKNMPQIQALAAIRLMLWGVPSEAGHDGVRGRCATDEEGRSCPSEAPASSFLTLPASCAGTSQTAALADSWQEPGAWLSDSVEFSQMTGCEPVSVEPTLGVSSETTQERAPSALQAQPGPAPAAPAPSRSAHKPAISHIRAKLAGHHLLLVFATSLKGSVTISGQGIHKYIKNLLAGNHTVRLALNRRGVLDLRHRRRVTLELMLSTPKNGSATSHAAVRL
jgi:hypothetical protein